MSMESVDDNFIRLLSVMIKDETKPLQDDVKALRVQVNKLEKKCMNLKRMVIRLIPDDDALDERLKKRKEMIAFAMSAVQSAVDVLCEDD